MSATAVDVGTARPHDRGWVFWSVWSVVAAFGTYFCMYGFRKPFTAATYSDGPFEGMSYKLCLVTAQVFGYTVSKFVGVKFVAEMEPRHRSAALVALVGVAELALLGFALVPPPVNLFFLFLNGLPLGMVFGLVIGFLEGRQATEALAAGLCASFIVADGVTKSVGAWLLVAGVSEFWMPFFAGLIFLAPLLFFVWMLRQIPAPSAADVRARGVQPPLDGAERWRFFARYATGLSLLIGVYLLATVLRSVRADFAPEIWQDLGTFDRPDVFARSETLVALGVILLNGLAVLLRNNWSAFGFALALSIAGMGLGSVALLGMRAGWLPAFSFMVLVGLGVYLPYIAIHTTVFERLIAMTRGRGNLGYLLTLADAVGYLGYVAVMLAANFGSRPGGSFLSFFVGLSWVVFGGSAVALALAWLFFCYHVRSSNTPIPEPQRA